LTGELYAALPEARTHFSRPNELGRFIRKYVAERPDLTITVDKDKSAGRYLEIVATVTTVTTVATPEEDPKESSSPDMDETAARLEGIISEMPRGTAQKPTYHRPHDFWEALAEKSGIDFATVKACLEYMSFDNHGLHGLYTQEELNPGYNPPTDGMF